MTRRHDAATAEWNLYLISVPYSLIHAAVFIVAGTGIIQARLVEPIGAGPIGSPARSLSAVPLSGAPTHLAWY
jgi:hypothetical protein